MQSMQPPTQPTRHNASNSSSADRPPAASIPSTTANTPTPVPIVYEDPYPTMDNFRRRAVSEVVRQSSSKWKIVAAFNNLRKSWEKDEDHLAGTDIDADDDIYGNADRSGDGHSGDKDEDTSCRSMGASDMDSGSFRKYGPGESGDQALDIDTPTYVLPQTKTKTEQAAAAAKPLAGTATANVTGESSEVAGDKVGADGTKVRPRKRVSLFLRRRGRFRGGNVPHSVNPVSVDADGGSETPQHFRRAQSHFVKPVSVNNEGTSTGTYIPASESGRYMEYERDFDFTRTMNSLRKLRPAAIRMAPPQTTDPGAPSLQPNRNRNSYNNGTDGRADADESNPLSGPAPIPGEEEEIIGEICLEDFADTGSEDFAFLDGQIVDVWTDDDENGDDDGSERVPTLRLDGQKISLFGEEEFAQFCKELLKPPKPTQKDLESFTVDEQWKDDTRIHNRFAAHWDHAKYRDTIPAEDIRSLSYAYN